MAAILRTSNPAGPLGLGGCFPALGKGREEFYLQTRYWRLGVCAYWEEASYFFRILLHVLKLTSERLSMVHQPALLTPKSGLWEQSNCLL